MGNAASELPYRFHLLRLVQGLLALEPGFHGFRDALFQRAVEFLQFGTRLFGGAPRLEQVAFIAPAIGCVEHRDADKARFIGVAMALDRIDQNRQGGAVGPYQVERHFIEEALHAQQGGEVGFVVDFAGNVQEVLKAAADHLRLFPAQPG